MGQIHSVFEAWLWPPPHENLESQSWSMGDGTWYCTGPDGSHPRSYSVVQPPVSGSMNSEKLCPICRKLGRLPSTMWPRLCNFQKQDIHHHHTVEALVRSAIAGCHLFNLIMITWEQRCVLLRNENGHWTGRSGPDIVALKSRMTLRFRRMKCPTKNANDEDYQVLINVLCGDMPSEMGGQLVCSSTKAVLDAFPEACAPSIRDTSTGSSTSICRMKAWLDTCTSSHPGCARWDKLAPRLPTRAIAVGRKGSVESHLVAGRKRRSEYATLSHCWGNPKVRPLTTTDATLALRQQDVRDDELPKTFKEAVHISRELGIEYLWIDSLCIIQDQVSQEDWAKEAPRMGEVYGNSMLTIAAADATDSTQGCFRDRAGLINWPCSISLFGRECVVSRYSTKDEQDSGDPGDLRPVSLLPLNKRAWVLQEQILSRRSIIFTRDRLVWRCATLSTNEKYPLGLPHAPNIATDNHRLLHCIVNNITDITHHHPGMDMYTCWYRMLQGVTSRQITFPDDRLPAVAGIARKYAAVANDSYHAGLWRKDLLIGLLWISSTLTPSTTARTNRAPSWSWASVNNSVTYPSILPPGHDELHIPASPLLAILDVVDPPTSAHHPFGSTSRATLHLSGALLPLQHNAHADSGLAFSHHGPLSPLQDVENFFPDDPYDLNISPETPWFCLPVCVQHGRYRKGMRSDPQPYTSSWQRALVMGVDEFAKSNRVFGLVLQACPGRKGVYIRVGACVVSSWMGCDVGRICMHDRTTFIVV